MEGYSLYNSQFSDRNAVRIAVWNVLGVVHSDADEPRVEVRAAHEDDMVALEVRDNGSGIPEAESEVVTGDVEITQLTHGSGLGLWVTQAVVDASGGRLEFGHADVEGGSVSLRLPVA